MERILLLLTLAIVPLSGCLDGGGEPNAPAPEAAPSDSSEVTPEPVRIQESIDLSQGEPGRDWRFTIHPGATVARVYFGIDGAAGTPVAAETNWCFTLDGPHRASDCGVPAGNVQVSVEVDGTETFYRWTPAPAGHYVAHFDSLPAVGTFVVDVNVQYD